MKIEQIPADRLVIMSDYWHRAFQANGCNPCCHRCGNWIRPGHKFQLATMNVRHIYRKNEDGTVGGVKSYNGELRTTEIMLCDQCDPKIFEQEEYKSQKLYEERSTQSSGGCLRINGQIMHNHSDPKQ